MKKFDWMPKKDSVADGCEVYKNFYHYDPNYEYIIIINPKTRRKAGFLVSRDMPEEEINDIIESMEINLI